MLFITPADIWQSSGQAIGSRHEEAPGEDRGFIAEEYSRDRGMSDAAICQCDDGSAENVTRVTNLAESPDYSLKCVH